MEELLIIRKLMFNGLMNLNDSLVAWRILNYSKKNSGSGVCFV